MASRKEQITSMKKSLLPLIAVSAAMILPSSAIQVTVNEDNYQRLDLTVTDMGIEDVSWDWDLSPGISFIGFGDAIGGEDYYRGRSGRRFLESISALGLPTVRDVHRVSSLRDRRC